MNETLSYYCRYNQWANDKMGSYLSDKPESILTAEVHNSFPSIRKTLIHLLSAERSWLSRMRQDRHNNRKVTDNYSSTQDAILDLINISKLFYEFVTVQEEAFFEKPVSYTTWDGSTWIMPPKIMVHHCMNHSTYHRGQLVTMLRQTGIIEPIPSTDLLYFYRDQGV